MVDFRLTAKRDAKAAKDFLNKAIERVRLHRPVAICTDRAQAYRRVIHELNHRYDPHFDSIRHKQPGVQGEIAFIAGLLAAAV